MKLSDVHGDRTLEVVADLIKPVASIAQDPVASDLFKPRPVPEGMEARDFFIERVSKSAPKLMKDHKQDLISILSTIEGTDPEEYISNLNLGKLIHDVIELMSDQEFVSFLSSSDSGNETQADVSMSA